MLEFSGQRRAFRALNVDLPIPASPMTITTLKNREISPGRTDLFGMHARGRKAAACWVGYIIHGASWLRPVSRLTRSEQLFFSLMPQITVCELAA
jgi:hypothetical protein